ncbi:MAG: hypothetical protein K2W96_13605, partial [Gemmataceae bacterium]|nr:hypothetical protein [Gemmataceae bacterium]
GPPPLPPARQVPVNPPVLTQPRRIGSLEYRLGPRTGGDNWNLESTPLADGRYLITISNGVVLSVRGFADIGGIEVEADRAVVWTRPNRGGQPNDQGTVQDLEFYMAGHVVMRTTRPKSGDLATIEADELYYDTSRHVAIAMQSRLELRLARGAAPSPRRVSTLPAGLATRFQATEPIILESDQLLQTSENTFEFLRTEVFSSKLPSDPGLKFTLARGTLEERRIPRRDILGRPVVDARTGQELFAVKELLKAENVVGSIEGLPFFYAPWLYVDAKEPLGPIDNIRFGGNSIFGFEAGLTLDMYKILGLLPPEGTRWKLYPDYMSKRGLSLGTAYTYQGRLFPPTPDESLFFPDKTLSGEYLGSIRLFGIHDSGRDNLGDRPADLLTFQPSGFRGRATLRHNTWDLPGGFDVNAGASFLSDRNYLEQYFKREFDNDPNQATFAYVKQQGEWWAWSGLAQVRANDFITTTEWLPRLDGWLQGVSLFDALVSNTQAGVGYARLRPSSDPINPLAGDPGFFRDYPFLRTTRPAGTGRGYVRQELSLPVQAGPVTLVPYAKGLLAEYTRDLAGDETGRAWGALGLRASLPLARLYPDAKSELLNVDGLMHKMTFGANAMVSRANEPRTRFPQLDRLNDDASEQMLREITPLQPIYNPRAGNALATSLLFDPQMFAVRRMVDNRIDTIDSVDVVQLEWRQRLQTRRGTPGAEHIVDWMTLDTSISLFPRKDRDNFGQAWSFLEYRYLWNIGDRTSFESTGWYDPQKDGPRVTTVGLHFDRPDRTSFYVGYRQIDPLQSRVATGSVTYVFSPKYAMTLSAAYDFGISKSLNNTLVFTRTGRDLAVSLGFSYNSLQNSFGLVFEIIPNLLGPGRGLGGGSAFGNSAFGR